MVQTGHLYELLQHLAARSRPLACLGSIQYPWYRTYRIDPPARGPVSARATSGNHCGSMTEPVQEAAVTPASH